MTDHDHFERWWNAHYIPANMTTKEAAWDAWQAGKAAKIIEGLDTMVSVDIHEDPNVDRQVDWHKFAAEMHEASVLAQRHGLVIASVPDTKDRVVEAWRDGKKPVHVRVGGWREMIDKLNDMEKRGVL